MIFNCLQCGKATSSYLDVCPYCKHVLGEMVETLEEGRSYKAILPKEEYKNSIFGLLWRKEEEVTKSRFVFKKHATSF